MSEHETADAPEPPSPRGVIPGIVRTFLTGPLSILFLILAALLGAMAILDTPREEEPQIVVPMADIAVRFPGHSPAEVEELVTRPLERILWQIDGVEHVYSISRRDMAMVTARFFVGEDRERSIVKLRDAIESHRDEAPHGVTDWVVKPLQIDDVPIVTFTLFSPERNAFELRRLAEELKARLDRVPNLSRSSIHGGSPREIAVEIDPEAMAARGLTLQAVLGVLRANNVAATAGEIVADNQARRVLVGPLLAGADEIENLVLLGRDDRLVRLGDIATVRDGPREPKDYVHIGFGPADPGRASLRGQRLPAVTVAFAKKKGANAVDVAARLIAEAEALRATVLPDDVELLVTRDYGRTANRKVNDLLESMLFAILTVTGLVTLAMGWREGLVVGLAVPVSFALALFVNYLFDFTINRVTLFALILSLGLVVDDPITNVDNIQRHILLRRRKPFFATLFAVDEVLPPVIMSTLVIVVSFLPMFFITGMMGPYMGPMAVNVPLTVLFSTVSALTFVPWLAYHLLRRLGERDGPGGAADAAGTDATPAWIRRLYRRVAEPFLDRRNGILLLVGMALLFVGSGLLVAFRLVPLKMLPFDNKDELQIVLDLPEGASLERTDRAVRAVEDVLATVNEVADYESYVGAHSPIDFNGLVRHYNQRRLPHLADIRINLVEKTRRAAQSHAIALRIRDRVTAVAAEHGALAKLVEMPPGPPVLATLTVEIRGTPGRTYADLIEGARVLQARMRAEDDHHIAEIDDMAEAPHERWFFETDRERAARHGLTVADVAETLRTAIAGCVPGVAHVPHDREPLRIRVRPPRKDRASPDRLGQLWLAGDDGTTVQLAELGRFRTEPEEQPIYRKDLERVVFVTAEAVGRPPPELVWDVAERISREPLPPGIRDEWAGEGEWQITVRVFRDLGIAFGVAMVGIYLLLTVQTGSFRMPLMIMLAIPLTVIGIAPGFFFLNVVAGGEAGGYPTPIFFTATGMIGMIALGGIVVRNSIVLIEFIQGELRAGKDIREAILASGAVRFRPIVLTALTTMLGAWPITLDPIFSGLAWALIFGLVASTLFTLLVIPTVYMMVGPRNVSAAAPDA